MIFLFGQKSCGSSSRLIYVTNVKGTLFLELFDVFIFFSTGQKNGLSKSQASLAA